MQERTAWQIQGEPCALRRARICLATDSVFKTHRNSDETPHLSKTTAYIQRRTRDCQEKDGACSWAANKAIITKTQCQTFKGLFPQAAQRITSSTAKARYEISWDNTRKTISKFGTKNFGKSEPHKDIWEMRCSRTSSRRRSWEKATQRSSRLPLRAQHFENAIKHGGVAPGGFNQNRGRQACVLETRPHVQFAAQTTSLVHVCRCGAEKTHIISGKQSSSHTQESKALNGVAPALIKNCAEKPATTGRWPYTKELTLMQQETQ